MSQPRVVTRLYSGRLNRITELCDGSSPRWIFCGDELPSPGVGGKIAEDKGRKLREILFSRYPSTRVSRSFFFPDPALLLESFRTL